MHILTFSLVSVGLAEIHGFKWVIGCFSLVFAGLYRSQSIVSQQHWGALKLVWCVRILVYTILEIDFIRKTRAWVWRYSLWILWCHPDSIYFS